MALRRAALAAESRYFCNYPDGVIPSTKMKNVYCKMGFRDRSVLIGHEMTMTPQCNTVRPGPPPKA